MWARLLNAVLGIWLMASPAVLGYGGLAADVCRIIGPVAASLAIIALSEVTRPLRWVNAGLGALLVVLPWVLGFPRVASVNCAIVGVLFILCARVRGPLKEQLGGGWSWLWGRHATSREAPRG